MAKAISEQVNRQIVNEYGKGELSQNKLAIALGVSKSHVFRILRRDRISRQSSLNGACHSSQADTEV